MAKENGTPTAAQKGKGTIENEKSSDGPKKQDETEKDKDGKPRVNGKPGEEPLEGQSFYQVNRQNPADIAIEELNEEDQNLKNELEMLVTRLQVS